MKIIDWILRGKQKISSPLEIGVAVLWLDGGVSSSIELNGSNISNANDLSGTGNDALQAVEASQPLYAEPNIIYDGTSDHLIITDNATVRMGSGDFTIAMVMDVDSSLNRLISKGRGGSSGSNYKNYGITVNNGAPRFNMDDDDTAVAVTGGTNIANSKVSVMVMRDGNEARILVNGVDDATPKDITGMGSIDETNPTGLFIGRDANTASAYTTGNIPEVIMYKKALSAQEVIKLQNYLASNHGL